MRPQHSPILKPKGGLLGFQTFRVRHHKDILADFGIHFRGLSIGLGFFLN